MDLGIVGRKGIVCASSRGLGRACAKMLAEAGCELVINGRDRDRLAATAAELRQATGAKITAVAGDVASAAGQQALFEACREPDILVNNNAGPPARGFRELDRQKMLEGVVSNMGVAVELIQRAIEPMVAEKFGRIVNITSGSVRMPIAGLDLSSGARAEDLTAFLTGVARSVAGAKRHHRFPAAGNVRHRSSRANFETTAMRASARCGARPAPRHGSGAPPRRTRRARRRLRLPVLGASRLYHRQEPLGRWRSLSGRLLATGATKRSKLMKLVRYGAPGREKPGMLDAQGRIRDLSQIVPDIAGETLSPKGLAKLRKLNPDKLPLIRGTPRLGACVGRVRNFIAIGLNYADHAAESGMPLPTEPLIFNKAPSSICGPNDDTMIPKSSTKLDYEVELGVVMGTRARYLAKNRAMQAVAGYCLANDVSERVFQLERGGQFVKGKSCESFGPLGPWLITSDEIRDPQRLDMWLTVNGESRQKGTTRNMVFGVAHLVWYCSQFFVLEPGDVIVTGTPPGVGMGFKPEPKFLKAGDVVRLGIDGLGEQQQKVVKFRT